jgi:hypothetical protein
MAHGSLIVLVTVFVAKARPSRWTVLALLLCATSLRGLAGASGGNNKDPEAARPVTVAGCIRNGDQSGEFNLVTEGGTVYGLRSPSVRFSQHVGHKVSVRGQLKSRLNKDDYDFEGSEVQEQAGKPASQALDLEVINLKTISSSCRQTR